MFVSSVYLSLISLCPFFPRSLPQVSSLFTALFSDYDSQLRPYINTTKPVVVSTALRINLLYNVDSKEETFQLDLFVNEYWVDPRLAFDASLYSLNNTLRIPSTYTPWQPDTFFFNSVKCLTIVDSSLTLSSDGTVFWSRHQSCTFHSAFYLADFPFDSQTLAVRRTSFSYTSSELTLKFLTSSGWRPDPEEDFTNSLWDFNYAFSNTTTLSFINTDSVNAYLVVDRKWLAYVLKMVLPMFLITLLSTMSYAVDPSSPPARVSFTVALILSIVTFNTVVSADLPKINYATMIDWYVWYCFLFVVSALGEYAIVNNMTVSKKYGPEMPFLIDDFALWTAPFTWIVLNLWYWPLYNSVGVQVFLAILWSSWIGANFYRVFFWNRHQGTRGMWVPLKQSEHSTRTNQLGSMCVPRDCALTMPPRCVLHLLCAGLLHPSFCKHLKTSWRRWRNPHAYEQEIGQMRHRACVCV